MIERCGWKFDLFERNQRETVFRANIHAAAAQDTARSIVLVAFENGVDPALPALLDQHRFRRQRGRWIALYPVRRLRGCLPGSLSRAGSARTDRISSRNARSYSRQPRIVRSGTGRSGRGRARRGYRLGHAQGRNALHSLRPVRRALSRKRDHHGGLPLGGEKPNRFGSSAIVVSEAGNTWLSTRFRKYGHVCRVAQALSLPTRHSCRVLCLAEARSIETSLDAAA